MDFRHRRRRGPRRLAVIAVLAVLLSLLIFVFEGVRDAFDPRKTGLP